MVEHDAKANERDFHRNKLFQERKQNIEGNGHYHSLLFLAISLTSVRVLFRLFSPSLKSHRKENVSTIRYHQCNWRLKTPLPESVRTMNSRRKSIMSFANNLSHGRPSITSVYSATLDSNDGDDRSRLSRCLSFISVDKTDIYHVLERQEGTRTLAYHLLVFALTLISLVFGSISTIDEWRPTLDTPLYYGELGLFLFFALELLLRIWSAGCRTKYRSCFGRFMFIIRPVILLDIFTLFGFTLSLATGMAKREFPSLTLKFLPPLQMIRFLRVDRQLSSWKILKGIIRTHRQELTVTLVIAFMFLITGSYLLHIAETPVDPRQNSGPFRSVADTMWFSIITVSHLYLSDARRRGICLLIDETGTYSAIWIERNEWNIKLTVAQISLILTANALNLPSSR